MIVKVDAFFRDPAEFSERENLEPAAVGQDGPSPAHESMKSAKMFNDLQARSQEEVIGVTENNLCSDRTELVRGHRLDGTLGSDRHEDWSFDGPVSRAQPPPSCSRGRIVLQ